MNRGFGAMVLLCACLLWTTSVLAVQGGGHGAGGHGQGGAKAGNAGGQGGAGQDAGGAGGVGAMLPPPPGLLLDFVMQHAADINLTDEQKKKLEELKKTLPPPPEKPAKDPELMELYKKMMDAKKNGDTEAAQALRKQIADKIKQNAPDGGKCMEGLKAILTPDQMAKLKELWKATPKGGAGRGAGGGHGGGQGGGHGGAKGGSADVAPCPFDL